MDKKQLLSRFSIMKRGLSRVLNADDDNHEKASSNPMISNLTKPITLTLSSDTIYHNSIITAEGCPDPKQFPCIIRWYNHELDEIYSSNKSLQFQPNVQDASRKIYCQWFPTDEGDDTSTLLPSKLAEIGPLKRNPALVQDAQAILDKGRGEFDIIIPKISSTQKQKLIIEGTKIHVYIHTKHLNQTKKEQNDQPNISSDELKSSDDLQTFNTEFDSAVMDVTMTRFLLSMNEISQREDNEADNKEDEEDEDTVWLQIYKIKPEYKVLLSRMDLLYFQIENGKGSVMLRAYASSVRERDILAIVIQALADAKMKRKLQKKRNSDLVHLRIDVLDGTDTNYKRLNQQNQIREMHAKVRTITDKMVDLQKDNIYLKAEQEKYIKSMNRMREASLLRREEMNKLSEENMRHEKNKTILNERIETLSAQIEEMENESEDKEKEIREAQSAKEDNISEQKQLKTEIETFHKKLELRESAIAEYEIEIQNLEDDRNQLRLTLGHLNAHVGKVQDDKSQMDQDFGSLNEEMIKYKKESRDWKSKYNTMQCEVETLRMDFENMKTKYEFEQAEHEKKRVELKQNDLEVKELSDQIQQMKLLKEKLHDIQYDVAAKEDNIQRLKTENEQLRSDLSAEHAQSTKARNMVERLKKKMDKLTTKNAKLHSQIDEFEDRVTDSVARPLYNELHKEVEDYKDKLSEMSRERDTSNTEIAKLKQLNVDFKQMISKLDKENGSCKEEMNQLQTHNTFWKNKVKSMREEIKKLHSQPMQSQHAQLMMNVRTPSPVNSSNDDNNSNASASSKKYAKSDNDIHDMRHEDIIQYKKQIAKLEKDKTEALAVVQQLKRALNNELHKANSMKMRNKILNSHSNEEVKTLLRKNNALKLLANELSDTVADKEQNIMHHKKVMKLLGKRVTELESLNRRLRSSINEIDILENTHALPNDLAVRDVQQTKPTIIIAKK